jgi:hypothetical protein
MKAPWEISIPKEGQPTVVNEPTPEGRAAGLVFAKFADIEEAKQRALFPDMLPRCDDCALRAGTTPNGCVSTLMDVLKCAVEGTPFFCHKGIKDGDEPKRLCTGAIVLMDEDARRLIAKAIQSAQAKGALP